MRIYTAVELMLYWQQSVGCHCHDSFVILGNQWLLTNGDIVKLTMKYQITAVCFIKIVELNTLENKSNF